MSFDLDFLCIGAMKAGTTWIHGILDEHPEVCMGRGKEVHFFDDEHAYRKGLAHYATFFDHCAPGRRRGEATPRYIHAPEVPARIHEHFPRVKLIASLRDPVDRAWSQFRFDVHEGRRLSFYKTFEEAIAQDHDLVERGFYGRQLRRYYDLFPREQILVVLYEDIQARGPGAMARRLYEFLGLRDVDFTPPSLLRKKNVTGKRRARHVAPWLNRLLYGGRSRLRRCRRLEGLVVRSGLESLFRRLSFANRRWESGEVEIPRMLPDTRARLAEVYREDMEQLALLTGLDLAAWG